MNPSVLVTGSSSTTGINVALALFYSSKLSVTLTTCDCGPIHHSPMNKFCVNERVPKASDPGYFKALMDLVLRRGIKYIIPTNDHEMRALALHRAEIEERGLIVNGLTDTTPLFLDKLETSWLFQAAGIPTPEVRHDRVQPFVVRKRTVGDGKKFVYVVRDQNDMCPDSSTMLSDDTIITRYEEGREYTIDILAHKGEAVCVVPRLRREVTAGMVTLAEIVKDYDVLKWSHRVSKELKFDGMYCVQCIKNDRGCHFFEVNPRPGSGIDLTIAAGVNMPQLWIQLHEGLAPHQARVEPDWDLKMKRYLTAHFFR